MQHARWPSRAPKIDHFTKSLPLGSMEGIVGQAPPGQSKLLLDKRKRSLARRPHLKDHRGAG